MVCAPVRSIIPELKLGDYLSVQAHNPCSISHLFTFAYMNQLDELMNMRLTDLGRVTSTFR